MRLGVDVRVHAQRNASALARLPGHIIESVQFGTRFDVEAENVLFQCVAHFVGVLADAREHGALRIAARRDHASEFTGGHDVETRTELGEHAQHGEVRVRLGRVVHGGVAAFAGLGISLIGACQGRLRIDIQRRAETLGEGRQCNALGMEYVVAVGKDGVGHRENSVIN